MGEKLQTRLVGIALGSNEDNRLEHLQAALRWLEKISIATVKGSRVYETAPFECAEGTPFFLNAVCEIVSSEDPFKLLRQMRAFERDRGRPESYPKNAPRTLDLDLLYAGDMKMDTEELKLPHPRILERRFVLQPLCDIRPDLILPGTTQPIHAFLASLPNKGDVKLYSQTLR